MMTVYEQIQSAIKFIEENLFQRIRLNDVAKYSGMSKRTFQNYFWMITGLKYQRYIVQRRLEKSLPLLKTKKKSIDSISEIIGYNSQSSFSKAFKREYKCSPIDYRQTNIVITGLKKVELYNKMARGIVVKELSKMYSISFVAFSPDSEIKAKNEMNEWLKTKNIDKSQIRIFGHNVDNFGLSENLKQNSGYKIYVCSNTKRKEFESGAIIEPGRFMVTGIEGSLIDDKDGLFIMEGWDRMSAMIKEKKFKVKPNGRWFEEELEPAVPGNLRLDLYVEIE